MENGVQISWLTTAAVLQGRHKLVKIRGTRRQNLCLTIFFSSSDTIYRDTTHYLTVCVVIKNQNITFFFVTKVGFELNPFL